MQNHDKNFVFYSRCNVEPLECSMEKRCGSVCILMRSRKLHFKERFGGE